MALMDRLWDKFTIGDGCWEWTASTHRGYGQISENGRPLQAHRVVYEVARGPIPDGMQLDHLCRNRKCVKPDHLEPVSQAENIRRGQAGMVHRELMAKRTHCLNGHEFTPENTYIGKNANGNPSRTCRACKAARERKRRLA